MTYRTYRTVVLLAALLLVSVAVPASLAGTEPLPTQPTPSAAISFASPAEPQTLYGHLALIADNRKYVAAEEGGGRELVANRDRVGPWETFVMFSW